MGFLVVEESVVEQYYRHKFLQYCRLPPDPTHKQYRIFLNTGKMIKIKKHLRTPQDLYKEILALERQRRLKLGQIKGIYYSLCSWLNPEKIGARNQPGYIADRLLIKDIIGTEIDMPDLEDARLEALKLLAWAKNNGYEPDSINFSGNKGFHIPLVRKAGVMPQNPEARLNAATQIRKILISELHKAGIEVCPDSLPDVFRIFRVVGTLHVKSGRLCWPVTETMLKNNPSDWLIDHIPQIGEGSPLISGRTREMMMGERIPLRPPCSTTGIATERGQTVYVQTFLSNKVYGTKDRYIPIFKYTGMKLATVQAILKKVAKDYRMAETILFEYRKKIFGVCLQAFEPRRLDKILKAAKSENINEFARYRKSRMPVTDYNSYSFPLKYLGRVESRNDLAAISRGHFEFFNIACELEAKDRRFLGNARLGFSTVKGKGEIIG